MEGSVVRWSVSEFAIPIRNVYYLFCYAWERFEEAQAISTGAEDAPDLPNLLARVLVEGSRTLMRRGLDRGYLLHEEELSTIRGHIELGATLALQARNVRRVTCTFDELSHDLLHNQILKASLRRLASAPTIDAELRRELQRLWSRMPDVTDIKLSLAAFRRVQLHRNNARYSLLLKICELAFESLISNPNGAGYAFQDVLRDERKMAGVFEAFVRNFYRASQREFRVSAHQLAWQAQSMGDSEGPRLPGMVTDIYLDSPGRRIIIDTKYYAEALQQHHGSASFRSGNLYQLFAYLRNDAVARPNAPLADGMLLYPVVGQPFDSRYELHGHGVRFATVDLSTHWPAIENRLTELLLY